MLKQIVISIMILMFGCGVEERANGMKWLKAKNGYLYDEDGKEVMLRGISTHGLAWYQNFYHVNSLKTLKDDWHINVFRLAMYTEGWAGYTTNPKIKEKVNELVDAAISLGLYVIIDWHILSDGNPQTYANQSEAFFNEMSERWAGFPNVIYEICNEPNGWANWRNSIRPYAERIIPVIRKNSPNSLIIVGTGSWSQDIQDPANEPLHFENLAYALHFYAGTHGEWLRSRIIPAKKKGITLFVSEWGMSQASGTGGVYVPESKTWLDFLEQEKISHINWSLAPKSETSAALMEFASANGKWTEIDLTESGKWVRSYIRSKQ